MPDKRDSRRGTYALILKSERSIACQIGKWGVLDTRPGYYVYVGSAFGPGGLSARISRHEGGIKRKHWHIDYLREILGLESIWFNDAPVKFEHRWAEAFAKLSGSEPVSRFGCSDCACLSHLFFMKSPIDPAAFTIASGCTVATWNNRTCP